MGPHHPQPERKETMKTISPQPMPCWKCGAHPSLHALGIAGVGGYIKCPNCRTQRPIFKWAHIALDDWNRECNIHKQLMP